MGADVRLEDHARLEQLRVLLKPFFVRAVTQPCLLEKVRWVAEHECLLLSLQRRVPDHSANLLNERPRVGEWLVNADEPEAPVIDSLAELVLVHPEGRVVVRRLRNRSSAAGPRFVVGVLLVYGDHAAAARLQRVRHRVDVARGRAARDHTGAGGQLCVRGHQRLGELAGRVEPDLAESNGSYVTFLLGGAVGERITEVADVELPEVVPVRSRGEEHRGFGEIAHGACPLFCGLAVALVEHHQADAGFERAVRRRLLGRDSLERLNRRYEDAAWLSV